MEFMITERRLELDETWSLTAKERGKRIRIGTGLSERGGEDVEDEEEN